MRPGQWDRGDFECGGAWCTGLPGLGVRSKFCFSASAMASFFKVLECKQMGPLMVPYSGKCVK